MIFFIFQLLIALLVIGSLIALIWWLLSDKTPKDKPPKNWDDF
ncbi:MAG: hypothetical protein ACK5MW_02400 [Enterococcus sp.]